MSKLFKGSNKNKIYGYGRTENANKYLLSLYNSTPKLVQGKILYMRKFSMKDMDKKGNNCTITAMTRLLNYYRYLGYKRIPEDLEYLYNDVLECSIKYGFSRDKGLFPTKIDNILTKLLEKYGYTSKSKGVYIWSFEKDIKYEIDNYRPVILNIRRGKYKDHTVTVSGYKTYKVNNEIYRLLIIHDGWNRDLKFIDFELFANNLILGALGSFNKLEIKTSI